ncbi:hypothetical protein [Bounagaea algeriensis]
MSAADIDLTAPAGRPIELPTTDTELPPAPPAGGDIAAAQSTDAGEAAAEEVEFDGDVELDFRGTDFDLDLGSSRAPVVLFAVLTGLAVLLAVVATTALPVQIGAGLVAVGAAALAVRALARRRRAR